MIKWLERNYLECDWWYWVDLYRQDTACEAWELGAEPTQLAIDVVGYVRAVWDAIRCVVITHICETFGHDTVELPVHGGSGVFCHRCESMVGE